MVNAVFSGLSSPSSRPAGQGHSIMFLGKTLNSHSASLHYGELGVELLLLLLGGMLVHHRVSPQH